MAISRFAASRVTQGLPKYQSAWDQDNVEQGALVPITSVTWLGPQNVVISNIPQIYQDLMLVFTHNTQGIGSADDYLYVGLNGVAGTNYSVTRFAGNGTTASSDRTTNGDGTYLSIRPAYGQGLFGAAIYHILGYANTTTFKTFLARNAADKSGSGVTQLGVGTMRSTSAITSLLIGGTSNFPGQGTSVTVYGIKAGA